MAEELVISTSHDKREKYDTLIPQLEAIILGEKDVIANLSNIAPLLNSQWNSFG